MKKDKSNIIGVGLIVAFFAMIALVGFLSNKVEEEIDDEEEAKTIDIYLFTTEYGEKWLDEVRDGNDEFAETTLLKTYNCSSNNCFLSGTGDNNVLIVDDDELVILNPNTDEKIVLDESKVGKIIDKIPRDEFGTTIEEINGVPKGIIFDIEEGSAFYSLITKKYEIDFADNYSNSIFRMDLGYDTNQENTNIYEFNAIVEYIFGEGAETVRIIDFEGNKYVASNEELKNMANIKGTNLYYVTTHISNYYEMIVFKPNGELLNDYILYDDNDNTITVKDGKVTIKTSGKTYKYDKNGNVVK